MGISPIHCIGAALGLAILAYRIYLDHQETMALQEATVRARLTDPQTGEHAVLELRQVGPHAVHSFVDGRWSGWEWPSMEAAKEHIRDSFLDDWRLEWQR